MLSISDIAVRNQNHLTATGNHMPNGITQCHLPPGSGDFTPAEAGTRFSDPGGMQAELTRVVVISQDSLPAKYDHLSEITG